jgi:spermidine/putrescine transport system substrate-binding protein
MQRNPLPEALQHVTIHFLDIRPCWLDEGVPLNDNSRRPMTPLGSQALSRRTFLRGVGLGGALVFGGSLLSACGGGSSGGGGGANTVNWSSWPEYIDVDPKNASKHPSIEEFTRRTGIKVKYTEDVNDNDEYFAKISPQLSKGNAIAADVFVVTDWMVDRLIRLGYLQKLDKANIPNAKNLDPSLQNVPFDKGREYSLTWQSGFTGIAYNPKSTNGQAIKSIDQLLTDPSLKGRVTCLTEMRDTMGLVMLDMGIDPEKFTDAEFDSAIAKLQKAVDSGQIRNFTGNEYGQDLASGDIAACMAWTGDVVQLQADNPDLQYVLPDAGMMQWSDNFAIPIRSRHKENAEKLINYYYEPDVAADVSEGVNYISPVVGAKEALLAKDPTTADNPLIFPDAAARSKAHAFRSLTDDEEKRYNAAFQKVVGS